MRRDVMVISLAVLGGYAQIRRVRISLPLIDCLVDSRKYYLPDDLPAPESRDLRRIRQGQGRALAQPHPGGYGRITAAERRELERAFDRAAAAV